MKFIDLVSKYSFTRNGLNNLLIYKNFDNDNISTIFRGSNIKHTITFYNQNEYKEYRLNQIIKEVIK